MMGTTLGQRIKIRMDELKIEHVSDVAKQAGTITRSRLSQIIGNPNAELSYTNTVNVARALAVTPEWLATGKGQKIASKATDSQWTAKWSDAQKQLLQDVRICASFLSDEQCRAFSELMKSAAKGLEQQTAAVGVIRGFSQLS